MEEKINKGYWSVIPADVRYNNKLKDKAKLLYSELSSLCNENGCCWATNSYFSELYGVSKETISRLLSSLKKEGYIDIKIEYDKQTKQVKRRIIYLLTKLSIPIDQKVIDPIDQKVKENNINILNNIKEYYMSKKCFPKLNKLTDSRKKKLLKRLNEQGEDNILKAIDIASNSNFLKGNNKTGWKMDFDWLIANDTNIVKILEGKYSNNLGDNQKEGLYGPIFN